MNSMIKTVIGIIVAFLTIWLVGTVFFWMLPYLLILVVILVVYFYIKVNSIKKKIEKAANSNTTYSSSETYRSTEKTQHSNEAPVDEDVADAIDVDYKEVD